MVGLNRAMQSTPNNNAVVIGCSMLEGTGKQGILTPDDSGYYVLVLGAYGAYNSAGMFYDLGSGASMFKEDSPLMRRLAKGVLYMEFKHPEPFWPDGKKMSDAEYMMRIRKIDDDRVCAHIRKLYLMDGVDEQNRKVKYVIGEVKPYGPYAKIFQDSLNNPHQNTYCSVRSITQDDVMRGIKYTREISTWDFVGEGGIYGANKYNSPALENHSVILTPNTLWQVEQLEKKNNGYGLESTKFFDNNSLRKELGWATKNKKAKPAYLDRW